jgi:hypothetical protein
MKDRASTAGELLDQALAGQTEALGQLLEAQRADLHGLAERQLEGRIAARVDASDILQQTFLEAYRSFPQFAGGICGNLLPGSGASSTTRSPAPSAIMSCSKNGCRPGAIDGRFARGRGAVEA